MYVHRKVVKIISQYNKVYEYITNKGNKITDKETLEYIKTLKIPPAYENVKINLNKNTKLLVTGYDVKGKKQYIYNQKWINMRSQQKFCNMIDFGNKLPKIKKDINDLLKTRGFHKNKLIALILKIIMTCHFRIGNPIGKDVYNSYGVSTLNKTHILNNRNYIVIDFKGKRGIRNICKIKDPEMIRLLNELKKRVISNKEQIFYYNSDLNGKKVYIGSCDVNDFLKNYGDFSTKDFRTWFANMYFLNEIYKLGQIPNTITYRKKYAREAITKAAESLHHTVAISKKKYINTSLINMYVEHPLKFKRMIMKHYHKNGHLDAAGNAFIEYLKQIC